jgi:hypothetical protein
MTAGCPVLDVGQAMPVAGFGVLAVALLVCLLVGDLLEIVGPSECLEEMLAGLPQAEVNIRRQRQTSVNENTRRLNIRMATTP